MQTSGLKWNDLNDGFVVAIHIEAKPSEAETVARLLADLVAPTMAEPGVKLFLPYRSPTTPESFFIFELYTDAAGWDKHQGTKHFKDCITELLPRVTKRERVPFVPILTSPEASKAPALPYLCRPDRASLPEAAFGEC